MLSANEQHIIDTFLALAPEPEAAFTHDELLGFLFGLGMTPCEIHVEEYLHIILGTNDVSWETDEQQKEVGHCLQQIVDRFTADFNTNQLALPFEISSLEDEQIATIYEWTSGFEEALALHEEFWDPEEFPQLSEKSKAELLYSMMVIQGMVEPMEVMDFFKELPDEILMETFPTDVAGDITKEMQIQVFLIASLPLTVQTLQHHARTTGGQPKKKVTPQPLHIPAKESDPPCGCTGCTPPEPEKKSKIIKGNFPNHRKKKS